MKKKFIPIILFAICIILIVVSSLNVVHAAPCATSGSTSSGTIGSLAGEIYGGGGTLARAGSIILGAIKWIGVAIIIGAIIAKGIKYVSVSPEGKAEIKKEMIMLAIGGILLFTFTTVLGIIETLVINSGLQNY